MPTVGLLQERMKHGGRTGEWEDSEMVEAVVAHFNISFMHPPKSETDIKRFGRTVNPIKVIRDQVL
jgi:hypothetical protein